MNIKLNVRTNKTEGKVNLRFRISWGRKLECYYKSNIQVDITDLESINNDGSLKALRAGKNSVYKERNQRLQKLSEDIRREIGMIEDAINSYEKEIESNQELNQAIQEYLNPTSKKDYKLDNLVESFGEFYQNSNLSISRKKGAMVLQRILKRYLILNNISRLQIQDIDKEFIKKLHYFILNEYQFVEKYPKQYQSFVESGLIRERDIPNKAKGQNTASNKLLMLKAYFESLVCSGVIELNPFIRLNREEKSILKERYDKIPIYLTAQELIQLMRAEVSEYLKETQQAFILQCLLGCRISDFKKFDKNYILVTESGKAYVSYKPQKTQHSSNLIVRTPLTKTALDIISDSDFNFSILKNISGKDGYNKRIKILLEEVGVNRLVETIDVSGRPKQTPISKLVSSKTARKTYVNTLNQAQIDKFSAGLHSRDSESISHYLDSENIENNLKLMNYILGEPDYRVDQQLNFID